MYKSKLSLLSLAITQVMSHMAGPSLQVTEENLDGVDAKYHDLYEEKDGKYVLTAIVGLKTQDDINALTGSLQKERNDHRETKGKLSAFTALGDAAEVQGKLDKLAELEAAGGGDDMEAKIQAAAEARIKANNAQYERKITQLEQDKTEQGSLIEGYKATELNRKIEDAIRSGFSKTGLKDPAGQEDAMLHAKNIFHVDEAGNVVAKDNVGVTPNIDPATWLLEIKPRRMHWFGESTPGGSNPGKGKGYATNPFTAEHWNMTQQAKIVKEDRALADNMAKAAGTTVGGQKPAAKK